MFQLSMAVPMPIICNLQQAEEARALYTMCKIAYFAGQMGGYNLNKVNGFLPSRDYT